MKLLKKRNYRSGIPAWVYILAFLFPIIIFIAGFALKGVYPFGEESALVVDGVHQYTAFYKEDMAFAHARLSGEYRLSQSA